MIDTHCLSMYKWYPLLEGKALMIRFGNFISEETATLLASVRSGFWRRVVCRSKLGLFSLESCFSLEFGTLVGGDLLLAWVWSGSRRWVAARSDLTSFDLTASKLAFPRLLDASFLWSFVYFSTTDSMNSDRNELAHREDVAFPSVQPNCDWSSNWARKL